MAKKPDQAPSKAGMRSLAKKESSRHGFEQHPGSSNTAGAFAKEERIRALRDSSRGATKPAKRAALPRMKKSS